MPPYGTTRATVRTNKSTKVSSFKSNENIRKKEPDSSVSKIFLSSVALNELAMKDTKVSFYTSNKNIPMKKDGPDRSVSNKKLSSVYYLARTSECMPIGNILSQVYFD